MLQFAGLCLSGAITVLGSADHQRRGLRAVLSRWAVEIWAICNKHRHIRTIVTQVCALALRSLVQSFTTALFRDTCNESGDTMDMDTDDFCGRPLAWKLGSGPLLCGVLFMFIYLVGGGSTKCDIINLFQILRENGSWAQFHLATAMLRTGRGSHYQRFWSQNKCFFIMPVL